MAKQKALSEKGAGGMQGPPCYMKAPFNGGMAMARFSEWQHSFSGLCWHVVLSPIPVLTLGAAPPGDALF